MKLLVIVPAYNEEKNIERVINSLKQNYSQYDYVIVNDGSKDSTSEICHKNNYNIIDLPVNLGLTCAFQTGMKYAWLNDYDAAVQFDGDGQHRCESLRVMQKEMESSNSDIVIGSRFVTKKKSFSPRMIGSRLITLLILLTTFHKIDDPTSGLRLYSRNVMRLYAQKINYAPEPDTVAFLIRSGCKVREVQVQMDERIAGTSYLNLAGSISYMFKICASILFVQWFRKRG